MTSPFDRFNQTVKSSAWDTLFPALEKLFAETIGHKLFSCSVFKLDATNSGTAARVYSNDEASYPISGLKEIVPNRWTRLVVDEHQTFVANSVGEFSDVFPDHEKIAALGLQAAVNLPVIKRGRLVGTVNILEEKGYYSAERCKQLDALHLPSLIAFDAGLLHRSGPTRVFGLASAPSGIMPMS